MQYFRRATIAVLLVLFCLPAWLRAEETAAERDARMAWWRDARFGMFIHWGVYSVPAGTYDGKRIDGIGEWIMRNGTIPTAEYREYAKQFNPTKYDPDFWAQLAHDAGMKYIVVTSKHHDGFAMFPSDVTGWDIVDASPYGKDVIGPLADAARKRGLRFGLYYSQAQDWMHPGGGKSGFSSNKGWDPAQNGDFGHYLDTIAVPQVREILTRYRPDVLWWDTPYEMTPEFSRKFAPLVASRPGLITNNRLGGGVRGDTETPEQYVPSTGFPGRDWETCMTMNDTWGYKSYDDNWKSTKTLVRNLIDIASKGGNYLLNIGPKSDGTIPEESIVRLREIGQWMKVNGESIYGTAASPFPRYSFDGRATVKGDKLYLHVYDWPAEGISVKGLSTPIKSATFLASGSPASVTTGVDDEGVPVLRLMPPSDPDPIATVVVLDLDGPIEIQPYEVCVKPNADGSLLLDASAATIVGNSARLVDANRLVFIGYWTEPHEFLKWPLIAPAGRYRVEVTYATVDERAGSEFEVAVGDATLTGKVAGTGGWHEFHADSIGEITLESGKQTMTLKALSMENQSVMNLQQVLLTPVDHAAE